jgi:hypothetical protein
MELFITMESLLGHLIFTSSSAFQLMFVQQRTYVRQGCVRSIHVRSFLLSSLHTEHKHSSAAYTRYTHTAHRTTNIADGPISQNKFH